MSSHIRKSILAGSWYPADPDALRETVDSYLGNVDQKRPEGRIFGIISPHAGYIYSGQTAAYGYQAIQGNVYDAVVILAPLHRMFSGPYVSNQAASYETPLGEIPVDHDILDELSEYIPIESVPFDNEHALEIQLPFLQRVLSGFKIVPILVGHPDVFDVDEIVNGLISIAHDKNVLFVASSDMHHMNDYSALQVNDANIVEAFHSYDLKRIRNLLTQPECSVCGRVPISIVMEVCQKLGADRFVPLYQTNSGDVTGEKEKSDYTVGYLSAVMVGE